MRGGEPAMALEEFYVAMFALMLQGSQANSKKKFEEVIAQVRNVRDAWKQVIVQPGFEPQAAIGRAAQTDAGFGASQELRETASWMA